MLIQHINPPLLTSGHSRIAILLLMLILLPATLHTAPQLSSDGHSQQIAVGQTPDGLTSIDWDSIQTQIASGLYKAYPTEVGGYVSANPAQGWQITYTAEGATHLTPRDRNATAWQWGLQLTDYGYKNDGLSGITNLTGISPALHADGHTLTYQWDNNLSEWWVNSNVGLEQGFILQTRPGQIQNQPLQLTLVVTGNLTPIQQGEAVAFVDANGVIAFTYDKLRVRDATGQTIPAHLNLGPAASALHIVVDDSHAIYPLIIDPLVQQAYLKASNTEVLDGFGGSVAVSGDTVVVGSTGEDSNATGVNGNQADNSATNSGAVYVFVRNGNTWSQQAYLKASNTEVRDLFGHSVAVSEDTVVVGAPLEDSNATGVNGNQANNLANGAGAAYVFVRNGSNWSQQAYLKASNTGAHDSFGHSVAVSGDMVVVGATLEDSNATGVNGDQANDSASEAGAAYVFVRIGTVWSQQAYLKASNTQAYDRFGYSVAVSGNIVVAGAYQEDSNATGVNGDQADNSAVDSGATYVFARSGTTWSQQAYLKASNTEASDFFGWSVAVSGELVVVGAHQEDSNATEVNGDQADNSAVDSGAAYVFAYSDTTWSQQVYLKASNAEASDFFGYSVAVSGNIVVAGAYQEDSNATGVNSDQDDNSAQSAGAAYVFVRSGTAWSQQTYLKASNTQAGDVFGWSVAASGELVVVGSLQEDSNATGINGNQGDNSANEAGAVYAFTACLRSAQSGDWENSSTWATGVVPINSDGVCIDTGHTVILNSNQAIDQLWIYPGGTLNLNIYSLTVEKALNNDGTIRQTMNVNGAGVEFLHIQNIAGTLNQYRGVFVDSSITNQNLGPTTVSVQELNIGESCPNTGTGMPVYARRCYEIVPDNQPSQPVLVRLYARTSNELNGISQANLAVYRGDLNGWTELYANRSTGSLGIYSYAQGDTVAFLNFLLGEHTDPPTPTPTPTATSTPTPTATSTPTPTATSTPTPTATATSTSVPAFRAYLPMIVSGVSVGEGNSATPASVPIQVLAVPLITLIFLFLSPIALVWKKPD